MTIMMIATQQIEPRLQRFFSNLICEIPQQKQNTHDRSANQPLSPQSFKIRRSPSMLPGHQGCRSLDFMCDIMGLFEKKNDLKSLLNNQRDFYISTVKEFIDPIRRNLQAWRDSPNVCQECKSKYETWLADDKNKFDRIYNVKEIWEEDKPTYLFQSVNTFKAHINEFEVRYKCN